MDKNVDADYYDIFQKTYKMIENIEKSAACFENFQPYIKMSH